MEILKINHHCQRMKITTKLLAQMSGNYERSLQYFTISDVKIYESQYVTDTNNTSFFLAMCP